KGQGVLAVGAFGERMSESLAEPMQALFDAYREALEEWPIAVETPQAVAFNSHELSVNDWINELRTDESGKRCRLLLVSNSLISNARGRGQYRWQHLLRPWVAHLAANAVSPMTTQLLSKAGHARFEPLAADTAQGHLATIMQCWKAGMTLPLPLAPQAAFAWLSKEGTVDSTADSDAFSAAASTYEGGRFQTGEVAQSAYLARQWPNFEALFNEGHLEGANPALRFAALADALYLPLYRAVKE
ncbi:MAG: exodeoxyribonuclease V subunit gamma, partial [Halomonas sp.]